MLEEFLGREVVIDLRSPFVCLGTLVALDDTCLNLRNADLHDLRDSKTSRENYVAAAKTTGIKHNRQRLVLLRAEIVAVARLDDVIEQ